MTAGTVVIAGGLLAAIILLTIVFVLCYCRLQYYCCRKEEPDKEEEEEVDHHHHHHLTTMSSYQPPSPEHLDEPEMASTFLTEVNGPLPATYSPPVIHKPQRFYNHSFCPSCTRQALPFYLQHRERPFQRHSGGHFSYKTVQQQELGFPMDLASFHHKLNLIRSVTMREVVTHSISTDV